MKISAKLFIDLERQGLWNEGEGKEEERREESESVKGAGTTKEKGEEGTEAEWAAEGGGGRLTPEKRRDLQWTNKLEKIRRVEERAKKNKW